MKKMSYAVAVESAINGDLNPEVIERLNDLKASLEKRANRKHEGLTKAQLANQALVEAIHGAMEPNVVYTTAEIGALIPELNGASSQKISPLMKKLVASGHVIAEKVKGKATYTLA